MEVRVTSIENIGDILSSDIDNLHRIFVVTDKNISNTILPVLLRALDGRNFDVGFFVTAPGEENKNIDSVSSIYRALQDFRADRSTLLVALGGGVVGDLAGFVASTYNRGIRWVNVPTTLLAQVDSSIGGKTGYNTEFAKNSIGTFWNPEVVIIDTDLLKTLPSREVRSGLAEVLKYALISDAGMLNLLEAVKIDLPDLVKRSMEIKRRIASEDPCDYGRRRVLNFGHTLGHALEQYFGYSRLTHGEAVALGIRFTLWYSNFPRFDRIDNIMRNLGLIAIREYPKPGNLFSAIYLDKKHEDEEINFVFLPEVGRPEIRRISIENLLIAYSDFLISDSVRLENNTSSPTAMP